VRSVRRAFHSSAVFQKVPTSGLDRFVAAAPGSLVGRMDDFDLHGWFEQNELESCPTCDQHSVLTLSVSGSLFCLECGELRPPDATPSETVQ
jgi:hypothetical protein